MLRTMFLQNLAAVGNYPTQCRKVAVINGANNGTLNPFQGTNTDLLDISLKRNGWKSIWGLCGDNICKRFRWIARTSTNSGSNKIADMWTLSPLFNVLFWVPPGYTNYYAQAAWGNSSLDNAPGGLIGKKISDDIQTHGVFLAKELVYLLTGDKPNIMLNINNFTMMPSYSAGDLNFGTNNSDKNLYKNWSNEYLCGKTPFDYVYAPLENQEHVSVSQDGSQWFENEVRCNITNLPIFTRKSINGEQAFCSSASYSVDVCGTNNNISWDVQPQGYATITGTGSSIILNKVNNGVITLTATVGGSCYPSSFTISKPITIGKPIIQGWYNSPNVANEPMQPINRISQNYNDACYLQFITTNMSISPGSTVVWQQEGNGSGYVPWTQIGNNLKFYFTEPNDYAFFGITATNACGSTYTRYKFESANGCVGNLAIKAAALKVAAADFLASKISIYPNPASNSITITLSDSLDIAKTTIKLSDIHGRQLKMLSKVGYSNTLPLTDFANGTYIVEITDGKKRIIKKIVKN
jgi:hypothetical protein